MFRISLIIPTHNRADQLVRALESVVRQDLPPEEWECVVIDNGSTDSTADRFAAFAAAHPGCRLRRLFEPLPGVSHARNRGLREAAAPIVACIDDDEWIEPGFLRAYAELFEQRPDVTVAGGRIAAEYPDGRPEWLSEYPERAIANQMDFAPAVRPFPAGRLPGGGNMCFRRSLFADGRFRFDPDLGRVGGSTIGGEENDLFERLRAAGHTLWYQPGAVMHHVIPARKLTDDYFRRLCRNIGISQQVRTRKQQRCGRARLAEVLKWGATLLLCLTLRPAQARRLLLMRREISRGLFSPLPR